MEKKTRENSFNGILNYLSKFDVPRSKKFELTSFDINDVMFKFMYKTKGVKVNKSVLDNAVYCQAHFSEFAQFVKQNYKRK